MAHIEMPWIKACPCCKGAGRVFRNGTRGGYKVFVKCQVCGLRTRGVMEYADESKEEIDWGSESVREAIDLWNRREWTNEP